MRIGGKNVHLVRDWTVPDKKIVIMMCQKHGRKKKMYKFTEKVEINVAVIAMWLIL